MRTVGLGRNSVRLLTVMTAIGVATARPMMDVAAELDARYGWGGGEHSIGVETVAGSARMTFADIAGDRFVFFVLAEVTQTFAEFGVHEAFVRVKGPMGKWNITLGRFTVPYGLLTDFSASRYLYRTVEHHIVGVDADNGAMVSGTLGRVDYAIAGSQGLGHHRLPEYPGHGLASGRMGLTLGEFDLLRLGLSATYGYTRHAQFDGQVVRRSMAGLDMTFMPGRLTLRAEASAGRLDGRTAGAGVTIVDYAVHPRVELTAAGSAWSNRDGVGATVFAGGAFHHQWVTIRGGYSYEMGHMGNDHGVSLQLYRRFSLSR